LEIRQIDGLIRAEESGNRDEKVGSVGKIRLIGCERDVGSGPELSPKEVKSVLANVKAHDLILGRERVDKSGADKADADHCDKRSSFSG
jgi:hypothetical protein